MEELSHAGFESLDVSADQGSKPEKDGKNIAKKRSLEIIEQITRKEGVSLSEQMWARLEKALDIDWK